MGEERAEDYISDEHQRLMIDTTHQTTPELGNRSVKSRISPSVRASAVTAPARCITWGCRCPRVVPQGRCDRDLCRPDKSQDEICDLVKRLTPDFVVIPCMTAESIPATSTWWRPSQQSHRA